jgi:DNA-binding NtrC family response regulator
MGDDHADRRADLRFIIGTNVDLKESIRKGRFREDLFYRINVLPIRVPPLAERADELVPWASYMLQRRHKDGEGGGVAQLAADAEALLRRTEWPGNLRQLDNMVRRAYAIALREYGAPPRDFVLQRKHFEHALAYEEAQRGPSTGKRLCAAADALVLEAERRRDEGHPLRMELADGFRGLVLQAAMRRMGGRDQAFRLFGADALVASRNHHKVARRELERARELLEAAGGDGAEAAALPEATGSGDGDEG